MARPRWEQEVTAGPGVERSHFVGIDLFLEPSPGAPRSFVRSDSRPERLNVVGEERTSLVSAAVGDAALGNVEDADVTAND